MLRIKAPEVEAVDSIQAYLNAPRLFAQILCNRGITTPRDAEAFLFPSLERLSDPFLLPDVTAGVQRVLEALQTGRKIALFGDYDADGVTSVALMFNFLKQVGTTPMLHIPMREAGYGLNEGAVRALKESGAGLLVCLDCGSTNRDEIELAARLGLDVVVIDHHEVAGSLPEAAAVINPKRSDSLFPTRELAAVGVTFFFLLALRRTMSEQGMLPAGINLKRELDLVALGTVADMVPLTGDNRLLVRFGMEVMKKKPRAWLKSFFKGNLVSMDNLDQYALNFIIIPRINATGRVSDPRASLDFLICEEGEASEPLLVKLNDANKQRQGMEEDILKQAMKLIEEEGLAGQSSLVLYREDWPIGIVGIVAQRLAEAFGKPSIVITRVNGTWKGSARGREGLDLHQVISTISPLLIKYGGHKYACGLSVREENLEELRHAFDREVKDVLKQKPRKVSVDAAVEFEALTRELVEWICMLEPFGVGNPRPTFFLTPSAISVNNRFVRLTDEKKRTWYGNMQKRLEASPGMPVGVVASPDFREEMGEKFIHLRIQELLPLPIDA